MNEACGYKEEIVRFLSTLPEKKLMEILRLYEERENPITDMKSLQSDMIFDVCKIPPEIEREVKQYEACKDQNILAHNKKWLETVKAMPLKTSPMPLFDSFFLEYTREIWQERISGLEDVYESLLEHIAHYLRTGRTRPVLLVGPPGCGKTKVMMTLGEVLEMPVHFANAVQMAKGNGLSGSSKTYISAAPGEPVEAMVRYKRGNLIFAIDEVDKTSRYAGHGGDFQEELLNFTSDESAHRHKDNFLGFEVDASHLFVIMTANELDTINPYLKSRCDIIKLAEPTRECITDIVMRYTVPKLLDDLKCRETVKVSNETIACMVSRLFDEGVRDVRRYQNVAERAINSAYLESVRSGEVIEITETEFDRVIQSQRGRKQSRIGF